MCWTTSTRKSAPSGRSERSCSTTFGPPVDEPTISVGFSTYARAGGVAEFAADPAVASVASVASDAAVGSTAATDLTISTS
jgi:hypothetical protein